MELPDFTDLGAVADELARRGKPKLRGALTQAWRVQSCLSDLRQATDCAKALRSLLKREHDSATYETLATERALLTTTIMLYVRATMTSAKSGERGPIQLEKERLTDEEWKDHEALKAIRNEALAHVRSSHKIEGHQWHREKFFAIHMGDGVWKPASATNQTGYREEALDQVERMLPVALREIQIKFTKRMTEVAKIVNEETKSAMLIKHIFDPRTVFGGEEGARAILNSEGEREVAIWVRQRRSPQGLT